MPLQSQVAGWTYQFKDISLAEYLRSMMDLDMSAASSPAGSDTSGMRLEFDDFNLLREPIAVDEDD